jgi:hypothetical protein
VRSEVPKSVFSRIIFSRRGHFANNLGLCNVPHGRKSGLGITISQSLDKLWIRLVDLEFTTGKTDAFEDLFDFFKEA